MGTPIPLLPSKAGESSAFLEKAFLSLGPGWENKVEAPGDVMPDADRGALEKMPHHYSALSDAEIDAHYSRRDIARCRCFFSLVAIFIVSMHVAMLASNTSCSTLAKLVSPLSFVALVGFVVTVYNEPNELERLDRVPELMEKTLALLKQSPAARRARDRIIASDRSLRVIDYRDFILARDEALHQQMYTQG